MPDAGTLYTDKAQREIEKRIRTIYREAQADIVEKLNKQTKRMYALDAQKRAELSAGKITEKEYKDWLMGQMFTQKQWEDKLTSVAETLLHANEQANSVVEGKKRAVFGENATYQAYKLEKDAGLDLSFSIYDSATVTRLIKQRPELLPRKVVNGVKDRAWNRVNIANAISQGVIQGESIPDIAKRIARDTASENNKAMVRYARTAMTGAQNAGRMETLHEAVSMGIKVKKRWLATLDDRTRDAHAMLDGQVQDVDKPFESELGDIMYPGDMGADPANVWNCRCTLINEYEEYPSQNAQRRDNISGELIDDMTYSEWKEEKQLVLIFGGNTDIITKVGRIHYAIKNSDLKNGLPSKGVPNSTIDKTDDNGGVLQRRKYNEFGDMSIDYDTNDHGRPDLHPTGAHKHELDITKKNPHGKPKPLTEKELEENKDIIQEGVNYHEDK